MSALVVWLALALSPTSGASEAACSSVSVQDSGPWWSCYVALETFRCEAQGWCS